MGSQVARAFFFVEFELFGVFEQESRAQVRTFGAVQPADGFVADFVRQRFIVFVRLFAQVGQIFHHGIVTRHIFQLGDGFVQFGVFVDVVHRFVEHGLQFQKLDVVFIIGKGLDRHHQIVDAVVNGGGFFFESFSKGGFVAHSIFPFELCTFRRPVRAKAV